MTNITRVSGMECAAQKSKQKGRFVMKAAIVGSRDFNNYEKMENTLSQYNFELIISGGARGADRLAEAYADKYGIPKKIMLADWNKYGKSAGYRRNMEMLVECDTVVAFWDGMSKGTKHMIDNAEKQGKKIVVIKYREV